ncbi:Bzz1p NDAI_0B04320 [Naumovozyma dairenensis CBS 421]|uniref:Protein BZZ1 n=1 Tax=Naumovozyma dairenensis (strain ATCC 10597 / BCRC 20456 / CBS 421 / NBRC 0211 / NRRL Y-12639) TaxID=1071378 RepID=G0W6Q5_NAUDC|nr:hypothetical protein NDAI_0B04320 [Naumovozyma dairenensis CBS 421]CCD23466.1 hypothetical protein NDAI_0B04320 [Naumovozyma dairenensis CBS 421]
MSAQLSIGNELKDSFQQTHKWVENNIKWLKELEQFYRERSKLEKEYSEKLTRLSSEYFTKKSSSSVPLSVGDTPATTPGSLEAAGIVAWNEVLAQTEMISKDHNKLAQDFDTQVANQLSGLHSKLDMTLVKIAGFNGEIQGKRDNAYQAMEKAKKNYDDACQSMELTRSKYTKSSNERNERKLAEKETAMNVSKNDYLIKISLANRLKDKYYFQDIPEALDLLQDLNEARILFLNDIWKTATAVERDAGARITKRVDTVDGVVAQNMPHLSTAMYIKHNLKQWKEPADFQYKPSPVWHDDENFIVKSNTEVQELKIKLAKSEQDYNKFQDMTQAERSKLASLNKTKQALKSNENAIDSNKFYENLKSYLSLISPFTSHETLKLEAEVTIESIQNNVPQEYDLSTDNIDVSKQKHKSGFFSKFKQNLLNPDNKPKRTSMNIHSGSSNRISIFGSQKRPTSSAGGSEDVASNDVDDLSSNYTTTTSGATSSRTGIKKNKVLYAYAKQDTDEISISPGDSISLLAADTGSGWTKIRNDTTGESGLVPTTYVKITENVAVDGGHGNGHAPAVPPPRRTTMPSRTLTAAYSYSAAGDDEISINVGDVITVIRGDDGSGWTYGELNGSKGLVPTSYCK